MAGAFVLAAAIILMSVAPLAAAGPNLPPVTLLRHADVTTDLTNGLSSGEQYLSLAQMVDNLLDGKSLLGHLVTPFFQGPTCTASLTKHLDPVKGGRSEG
jgi:hypothetical protein